MKHYKLLPMVLFAALMVFITSCAPLQGSTYDTYDDNDYRRGNVAEERIMYNNGNPVLVRDAFSGRLFYVYPNVGYSQYGNVYDNRFNDSRYYNNRRPNNNRNYRNNTSTNNRNNNNTKVVTQEQRNEQRQKQEESRNIILGKKN